MTDAEIAVIRAGGCGDHRGPEGQRLHPGTILMKDRSFICARAYEERVAIAAGAVGRPYLATPGARYFPIAIAEPVPA